MNYIEVAFTFEPATPENREIVAAMASEAGFDSFNDTKQGINGYAPENLFNEEKMKGAISPLFSTFKNLDYTINLIEAQNWNKEWEKSFEPIHIGNRCCIRAPFHPKTSHYEFDIVIEPKMSFGTGHHATTALMVEIILQLDLTGKVVLDMGCGTGVLGILAAMKKAKKVVGIDIDTWAYENSIENACRNLISTFEAKLGDASLLAGEYFDIILANINRNILLNDMEPYVNSMKKGSQLVLSGFYIQDLPKISEKATQLGLTYLAHIENEQWTAVRFIKNS